MKFAADLISEIIKLVTSDKIESDIIKTLAGVMIEGMTEEVISKVEDFIKVEKVKMENILSRDSLKEKHIKEENIDYIQAEIKDLLLEIGITDEVLELCQYDDSKLADFLWDKYSSNKKYVEYDFQTDIKKVLQFIAKEIMGLKYTCESFNTELLVQIKKTGDDIYEEQKKIKEDMEDGFKKIKDEIRECSIKDNNEIGITNRANEYLNMWNKNMFLNDFDKHDENAGINIKLCDVYKESHLPHYIWKTNVNHSIDLNGLLHEYIYENIDNGMLLILGHAGIGKSTLITWIMANFVDVFDNFLVYRFATDLKNIEWKECNSHDIVEEILGALKIDIRNLNNKILIIDGFDEISAGNKKEEILNEVYYKLVKYSFLKKFTLIITCRENYIQQLDKVKCNYITLQAWDEKQIESFYAAFQEQMHSNMSEQRLKSIKEKKDILGIPLILYMVLALDIEIENNCSIVDVYDQLFSLNGAFYERCIKNASFGEEHRIKKIEKQIHQIAEQIAIWMFENEPTRCFIPQKEYSKICDIVTEEQRQEGEEIKDSFKIGNLFKEVKYCEGAETEKLYFVHRSIYEYFVAETIYESIKDEMSNLNNESEINVAKKLPIYFKKGKLSPAIGEYLQYKIIKFYNSMDKNRKERFYQWWENIVGRMIRDGMFCYSQRNDLEYANIINKEMVCFLNLVRLLRLLLYLGDKKHIAESINKKEIERYIKHLSIEYEMTDAIKPEFLDLSHMDLNGINLKGVYLKDAILKNADLRGACLKGADLRGADLMNAKLNGANLKDANLSKAKLDRVILKAARVANCKLNKADLRGADLRGVDISEAHFDDAILHGAKIDEKQIPYLEGKCKLSYADVVIKDTEDIINYREYSRGKRYSNYIDERSFKNECNRDRRRYMQEKLLNSIHEYLYTRKIDLKTSKPYIDDGVIRNLIAVSEANNRSILSNLNNSKGQYFHVLNYADGYVDKLKHDIDMISCLFPKRLIVTSFLKQGDMKYLLANIYKDYKDLIKAGVLDLYIETVERGLNWNPEKDSNTLPEVMKKSNIMLLTQSYSDLQYEGIKILLPWLQNARSEDYLELIHKYDLQFEIYCKQIDKICKIAKNPEELTQLFIQEVKDAFIDIRIALEKKHEELYRKGINTVVGSVATVIPLLLPEDINSVSPELLSGILGATNVVTVLPSMFGSIRDVLQCEKYSEYWLLWKWNKITMD